MPLFFTSFVSLYSRLEPEPTIHQYDCLLFSMEFTLKKKKAKQERRVKSWSCHIGQVGKVDLIDRAYLIKLGFHSAGPLKGHSSRYGFRKKLTYPGSTKKALGYQVKRLDKKELHFRRRFFPDGKISFIKVTFRTSTQALSVELLRFSNQNQHQHAFLTFFLRAIRAPHTRMPPFYYEKKQLQVLLPLG